MSNADGWKELTTARIKPYLRISMWHKKWVVRSKSTGNKPPPGTRWQQFSTTSSLFQLTGRIYCTLLHRHYRHSQQTLDTQHTGHTPPSVQQAQVGILIYHTHKANHGEKHVTAPSCPRFIPSMENKHNTHTNTPQTQCSQNNHHGTT